MSYIIAHVISCKSDNGLVLDLTGRNLDESVHCVVEFLIGNIGEELVLAYCNSTVCGRCNTKIGIVIIKDLYLFILGSIIAIEAVLA